MKFYKGDTYDILEIGDYVYFDLYGKECKEKVDRCDICFRKHEEENIVYAKYYTERGHLVIDCFCNAKWLNYFENEYTTHEFVPRK